jgi:hypothetical protein
MDLDVLLDRTYWILIGCLLGIGITLVTYMFDDDDGPHLPQ